ncbi:involucrin repeat protein [Aspergillus fischeri NRRL 181]|uniref:Involucrin repeat protein n=1 Tax=Neosartorya fischeri (strain ATCC 1020 / DSM 3700 / CBS 544.65 / FGSC A1164 / JCM 1740 / NRRL 181 / WB 181) TaxID=331117 RepID=A1CWI8_NEOFI|nr:involucrin repeat protein [Aspergillus fischeri NRRL 181]EAW24990.1 involucrin repeat protein [Aspergillus fischeri NRRL 181]KAG2027235.1 hypothetical protein GB937_000973 [Aspergillus fischeri]
MNDHDRFSQSSYGDPRYLSSASFEAPPAPPAKVLMNGYRETFEPQYAEKLRYNPLNPSQPRSPSLLNANDPVAMYLLTETAMGDSMNYEIMSLEEVEALKKDYFFLSSRLNAAKRKLALEMKLRDAALSLSRLNNSTNRRASEEYDAGISPKSRPSHRNGFGATDSVDKTEEELAESTRKCEELANEIWNLERKAQHVRQRLLEHTAGVLQMTHKGLKKNLRNVPHTPESLSSHNTRGSIDDFDDRSLYKTSDNLDGPAGSGSQEMIGLEVIGNTERRLEALSENLRDMVLRLQPESDYDAIPRTSDDATSINPTATVEALLAYIERGLNIIAAKSAETPRTLESDHGTENHLVEINARLHHIVGQSGLSRSQALSPPPASSGNGLQAHFDYLNLGIDDLHSQIEKLLEQKSILTTQIQQQRELNSKSDAERDAHIADLVEQIAHLRKDLELSEQGAQSAKDELDLAIKQLEALRQELNDLQQHKSVAEDHASALASEKEARVHAEAELSRLQTVIQELKQGRDDQTEADEARVRAEHEVARLESHLEQLRSESASQTEELTAARLKADSEVTRLQSVVDQLRQEANARAEEAVEARDRAEQQVLQLEQTMQQVRNDADARIKEALDSRVAAEESATRLQAELSEMVSEVSRLQDAMGKLRADMESRVREAAEGRTNAEQSASRLQAELTEMEGEVVRVQTELTMAKAELDGAYGSRAQRAAEVAANPAIQKELDALNTRNLELAEELAALKAGKPGSSDLQQRVQMLERELRETIDDYEVMTKASIEFEKERERYEGMIDGLRDRCEQLETQLNEERINWMGVNNAVGRDGTYETTSTMVLKNEFKKMMRDTRIENMKILKAEQEERRRLETQIRNLKKEQAASTGKSSLSQSVTAL